MTNNLAGKHAVVTGGSSGIGAAVVRTLSAAGASVTVLAPIRAYSEAEMTMYDNPKVDFNELDVGDSAAVTRVFATIAEKKGIDISVLSAGLLLLGTVLDTDDETWRKTMAVNLDGLFFTTRESVRHMMAQGRGGKIVTLSSISGYRAHQGCAAYCAAKGGVLHFTRAAAMDCAAHGINVNGRPRLHHNADDRGLQSGHKKHVRGADARRPVGNAATDRGCGSVPQFKHGRSHTWTEPV
jgi:NAD(P)-dependent dehydrogenase (short-subunit alcohol dehydrogenase family)